MRRVVDDAVSLPPDPRRASSERGSEVSGILFHSLHAEWLEIQDWFLQIAQALLSLASTDWRTRNKVPHAEVFQHVSSVLEDYGFCPTGDPMHAINLRPYDCRKLNRQSGKGLIDAIMAVMESANLDAAEQKATTVGMDSLPYGTAAHHTIP
ncbi:hypothetical protein ZWY2020_053891 [Hordeum vulgare]|nr:hypothetical protein ZWY2020_053891 [Hordeum vulgare]